jgi:para-aminobenzoate synthetase component 1
MSYEEVPICIFNSNNGDRLVGFECEDYLVSTSFESKEIDTFLSKHKEDYTFLALNYNLKNPLMGLTSKLEDKQQFPMLLLWSPKFVVNFKSEGHAFLKGTSTSEVMAFLDWLMKMETNENYHSYSIPLRAQTSKNDYLSRVNEIKKYLQRGDIYEVNYCQEFFANDVEITNPLDLYFKLNHFTQAPFSAYLNFNEHFLFCASPERFIQKKDGRIISQPIKGTAARGITEEQDRSNIDLLMTDPKEHSENVIIVDLVRNDLSKIAARGSVKVDELCKVYSFPTVHQLISTVSCEPNTESFYDIIRALFPMGSMTGAPKKRALEIIDEMEDFNRGLYSGSIGYIDPKGDFDLNVVIRSLVYNNNTKRMSCGVGSAITISSDPEKEHEECLIKIEKMRNVITS